MNSFSRSHFAIVDMSRLSSPPSVLQFALSFCEERTFPAKPWKSQPCTQQSLVLAADKAPAHQLMATCLSFCMYCMMCMCLFACWAGDGANPPRCAGVGNAVGQ